MPPALGAWARRCLGTGAAGYKVVIHNFLLCTIHGKQFVSFGTATTYQLQVFCSLSCKLYARLLLCCSAAQAHQGAKNMCQKKENKKLWLYLYFWCTFFWCVPFCQNKLKSSSPAHDPRLQAPPPPPPWGPMRGVIRTHWALENDGVVPVGQRVMQEYGPKKKLKWSRSNKRIPGCQKTPAARHPGSLQKYPKPMPNCEPQC